MNCNCLHPVTGGCAACNPNFYWRNPPYPLPAPSIPPMQRGWECPKCGRVNAPWMAYCTNQNCGVTPSAGTNIPPVVNIAPEPEYK